MILLPSRFGCFLVRAYPGTDPGHHVSRVDFYLKGELADVEGPKAAKVTDYIASVAQDFAGIIRDEDYVMSASQQTAANAATLAHVVFGRNEPALHHYHDTYAHRLGLEPTPKLDAAEVTAERVGQGRGWRR